MDYTLPNAEQPDEINTYASDLSLSECADSFADEFPELPMVFDPLPNPFLG